MSSQVGYKPGDSASFDVETKSLRPPELKIQKIGPFTWGATKKGSVGRLNQLFSKSFLAFHQVSQFHNPKLLGSNHFFEM